MSAVRPQSRLASEVNPFERSFSDNPKENQGKADKNNAAPSAADSEPATRSAAAASAAARASNAATVNGDAAASSTNPSRGSNDAGAGSANASNPPSSTQPPTPLNGRRISERNRNSTNNNAATSVIPAATTPSKGITAEPSSSRSEYKTVLPPVASITSPSGDSSTTSAFPWGSSLSGSLRAGPLSPAMLAGPQSSSNTSGGPGSSATRGSNAISSGNPSSGFDPQSFRTGFTPDLSNFRTGLTPLAGGPSSFPPPSPNTAAFLAMVTNGPGVVPPTTGPTITPNTLAALTGQAPPQPGGSNHPNVTSSTAQADGDDADGNGMSNGQHMAANGLFLLSQAQQMEMAKQDDPEAAAAAETLQGVSQIFTQPGAGGNPDAPWPGAVPGTVAPADASAMQADNSSKKGGAAAARGNNKRKTSANSAKGNAKNANTPALPVAKKAKTTSNAVPATDAPKGANQRRDSTAVSVNASSENGDDFKHGSIGGDFDDSDDDGEEGDDKSKKGRRGGKPPTGGNGDDDEKRKNFLERNRQAALKCRQRKKAWLASLQARVEYLTADNEQLQTTVARQAQEIMYLKSALAKAQSVAVQHGIPATELQVPPINMNAILHPGHHPHHMIAAIPLGPPAGVGVPVTQGGGPAVLPPGVPIPSSMGGGGNGVPVSQGVPNGPGSTHTSPINPAQSLPASSASSSVAAAAVGPPLPITMGGAAQGAYSAHSVPRPTSHLPYPSSSNPPPASHSRSATPAHVQAVG